MVKENKKSSSETIESQITNLVEFVSKIAKELPRKHVGKFAEDMQQAANRRKKHYMYISSRSSRSYVMNTLRERIIEWKPGVIRTPYELARELPYEPSSIYGALRTLYEKDEEVDVATVPGESKKLWFKPERQSEKEISLPRITLDEWIEKIGKVNLEWYSPGPHFMPVLIETDAILPMIKKAVAEKDVSDIKKFCDYQAARLKEPTEMALISGLSKEFESFWRNYAERLEEEGCVNIREEKNRTTKHLSDYRFKDPYSNKLALTRKTEEQLTLLILEELRITGFSTATHDGAPIALYCPTLIRRARERKFFK